LSAETVLLQESFEGPVGKPVAGWNGWTGDAGVVISPVVIDQDNSITWAGDVEWPVVCKPFAHVPGKGEVYVLTATLNAPDATGAYADVRLSTGQKGLDHHVAAQLGYRGLSFEQNHNYDGTGIRIDQSAPTMDVRLVASDTTIACYYRNHGESGWTLAGRLKALNAMSAYHTVMIAGGVAAGRSVGGGVDNIQLAVRPAEARSVSNSESK
jgi:hypothetical protein